MIWNLTQMTDPSRETEKRNTKSVLSRVNLASAAVATTALLIASVYLGVFIWSSGQGTTLSEYEKQAIDVVSMQNKITARWNQTVDAFNDSTVYTQEEHVVLFSTSLDSVHDLITDSQAVIDQWIEIDVPSEHASSYQLGLQALMAMQDGLILFGEYFQNSIDTLVSDQIRAEEASAKLVYAAELWQAAAEVAATEG